MKPTFQVQLKIRKPVGEVFDAVADPKQLSGYFVQAASGPLEAGKTVMWRFAEVAGEYPVVVREVVRNERIVFEWDAPDKRYSIRVEMAFKPLDASNTMVQVSEAGWRDDAKSIANSYGNAGGWMHMMLCLKGYLEYGINLRAGSAF